MLTGDIRLRVRDICRQVCREQRVDIIRGVLSADHVHMFVSVPPKLAVSDLVRLMKSRDYWIPLLLLAGMFFVVLPAFLLGAWAIVQVRTAGSRSRADGSSRDFDIGWAWITLYERHGDGWLRLADVSTNRPND